MSDLFAAVGMMPQGYCLLWKPWLVALHAGSDALIFASYFIIPLAILRFLRARADVRFGPLGLLFAAFILLCGVSHLVGLVTLWYPVYELQGVVKLLTALVSVATAAMLFPLLPKLVALPSPAALEEANARLTAEVERHRKTLAELEAVRASLEDTVAARTEALTRANEELTALSAETVQRSRSLLAVVQSIARQTTPLAPTKEKLVEGLVGRMDALGRALSAIADGGTGSADLAAIVEGQVQEARHRFPGRIEVSGPPLRLRPDAAQHIALAIHELCSNAEAHGGLAHGGTVSIGWRQRSGEDGAETLKLVWREGSSSFEPGSLRTREGFGVPLLSRTVPAQLSGRASFEHTSDGFRYVLEVPVLQVEPQGTDRRDRTPTAASWSG